MLGLSNMQEDNKYYQAITKIVSLKSDLLNQTIMAILDQEISNYPIIVVSALPIEIGVSLSRQANVEYHIHATTLEEMVVKNIFTKEKIDDFRKLYKEKSSQHYCFFLLDMSGANFVFHPKKG